MARLQVNAATRNIARPAFSKQQTLNVILLLFIVTVLFVTYFSLMPVTYYALTPDLQSILKDNELRWTPKTKAVKCENMPRDLAPFKKSMSNEDTILLKWFKGLCGGSYIEIGGLDGVTISNSHVFNKALGWTGLLVEASPINFKKLAVNRPNDITVHAGVCKEEIDLHWVELIGGGSVGGFREFAAEEFQNIFWKKYGPEKDVLVTCKPLSRILTSKYGEHAYFDFFSLDIEGAEYEALVSLDFQMFVFGLIFVECDGHNPRKDYAIRAILEKNGYDYLGVEERSCWFANRKFEEIYGHLYFY